MKKFMTKEELEKLTIAVDLEDYNDAFGYPYSDREIIKAIENTTLEWFYRDDAIHLPIKTARDLYIEYKIYHDLFEVLERELEKRGLID